MSLLDIPQELRDLPQWVGANMTIGTDGKPLKEPINPRTKRRASVNNPADWGTFDEAVAAGFQNIGFVFSVNDNYAVIDLDNKPEKPATEQQIALHNSILTSFESYTEKSVSGSGYHIIVKGKVPSGVNRDNVEVYSSGRYMIFTGNVVRNAPIQEYQAFLDRMYGQMKILERTELTEVESDFSDSEVVDMAHDAMGELFLTLCRGEFLTIMDEHGRIRYGSQSEADMALVGMLADHTVSNQQVRNIFRMTELGKREKAIKNDTYLNFTISRIRTQQEATKAAIAHGKSVGDALVKLEMRMEKPIPVAAPATQQATGITRPPGLMGELMDFFYQTANRQVPEMALAATISFMAAITARQYNIGNTGLATYMILLAETGTGKEGMQSGINKLINAIRPTIPQIAEIIGPGAYASGQALAKKISENQCYLSILGEFGLTLRQMTESNAPAHLVSFRRNLLDLYGKTGQGQVMFGSAYSDSEKNVKDASAPNLSILGEGTPSTFYEKLTPANLTDGMIPRMMILEYTGKSKYANENDNSPPSQALLNKLLELVTASFRLKNEDKCIVIHKDDGGLLKQYDDHTVDKRNESKIVHENDMWSRAGLKANKLAGLVAVGVNYHNPVITPEIAKWAITFVNFTTNQVLDRFKIGDVGSGDNKRLSILRKIAKDYLKLTPDRFKSYRIDPKLFEDRIIQRSFFQTKAANFGAFSDKDQNNALKSALLEMVKNGELVQISPIDAKTRYGKTAELYQIGENLI